MHPRMLCCLVLLAACSPPAPPKRLEQTIPDGGLSPPIDAWPDAIPYPAQIVWSPNQPDTILIDGSDVVISDGVQLVRIHGDGTYDTLAWLPTVTAAQDSSAFYVAYRDIDDTYGIISIDKASGGKHELARGLDAIASIAADADEIYFDTDVGARAGELWRIAKATGQVQQLSSALHAPADIAVDDNYVYVADVLGGEVLAFPRRGGSTLVLATALSRPTGLLVAGNWLYLTERGAARGDGRISRIARPACPPRLLPATEILRASLDGPMHVTVDATHVYWTSYYLGLLGAPLAAGPPDLWIDAKMWGSNAIARTATALYFASRYPDDSGGLMYELPKP